MPPGTSSALHLGAVLRVAEDLLGSQHAGAQDVLAVVDVRDERVQRLHALAQSRRELAPLAGREDARHDVERDQPLVAVLLAVDGERDADAVEEAVGFGALLSQRVFGLADQPVGVDRVGRPHLPVGGVHLVERRGWGGDRFHESVGRDVRFALARIVPSPEGPRSRPLLRPSGAGTGVDRR